MHKCNTNNRKSNGEERIFTYGKLLIHFIIGEFCRCYVRHISRKVIICLISHFSSYDEINYTSAASDKNIPYAVVSHRTVAERVRKGRNVDRVIRIIMTWILPIVANLFYARRFNNIYTSES
jgi:hypothetical protein